MVDTVKISELPAVVTADGTSVVPCVQGGITKQQSNNQVAQGAGAALGIGSSTQGEIVVWADSNGKQLASKSLSNGQLLIGSTGAAPVGAVPSNGTNISWTTGSGTLQANVSSTPTFTTVNGMTITPTTGTVTLTNGKTLSINNTLTLSGTDASTVNFSAGGTVAYTSNNLSVFASTTSAQLAGVISDETGSGSLVFATSPALVTPNLGTPASGNLANCTGFPTASLSGLGAGVATFLATPTSANLATAVTDETGTGSLVFATSPTLVTPVLGVATATSVNRVAITQPATAATLTIANNGSLITSGAFAITLTSTGTTNVTLPTSGTLTTLPTVVSTANTFTAAQAGAFVALTDAATVAINSALGNNFNLVTTSAVGATRQLGVPTNMVAGRSGVITVRQDISGSRALTYAWPYIFPAGSAPVLSTAALAMDQLNYMINFFASATVTITIATPAVVTWTAHGLASGQRIQLTTTGALPTGLSVNTTYWVTVLTANTFQLSTSLANAQAAVFIATSGTQSGTHTATSASITITINQGLA